MGAYLGLRDSWFWEDDAILDAIETLQDQADGTFYPAEYGPEGHTDIACPNLWGYLIPQEESEPLSLLVRLEDSFGIVPAADGTGLSLNPKAPHAPKAAMAIELWAEKRAQLENGKIDADEYEDWKASL